MAVVLLVVLCSNLLSLAFVVSNTTSYMYGKIAWYTMKLSLVFCALCSFSKKNRLLHSQIENLELHF